MPKRCSAMVAPEPAGWADRPGANGRAYPAEGMIRLVCRAVPPERRAAQTALDVGCGGGRHAVALAELGFGEVIAIDPEAQLVEHVSRHAARCGATIRTRLGRLPELPLPDGSMDLIVAWGVLFVLGGAGPTRAALHDLRRIMRPAASLVADWRCDDDGLRGWCGRAIAPETYELAVGAPAGLAGACYSFWSAEQVRALHEQASLRLTELHRCETRNLVTGEHYAWWQTCATH